MVVAFYGAETRKGGREKTTRTNEMLGYSCCTYGTAVYIVDLTFNSQYDMR